MVVLQPESVADMLSPRYESDHGIFWFVTNLTVGEKQRNLIGHNGGDPGAFSYMFFDPDTATGYLIAGNGESDFIDPYALANLTAALFEHADNLANEDDGGVPVDDLNGGSADNEEMTNGEGSASGAVAGSILIAALITFSCLAFGTLM